MDYRTKITAGGRIVIPIHLREKLALKVGDDVILREDDQGTIQLMTYHQQLNRIRALAKQAIPPDVCLTDELSLMRREEAKRENSHS